jgi:polyferredoxin
MACPIGLMAQYAAMFPAWATVPWLLIGVLVAVGALVGTLVCGWACPFGFLQDLLGRVTSKKLVLPDWIGYFRYVVLFGLVLFLPWYYGTQGIMYDEQPVSICRLCPAGAAEAGLYYSLESVFNAKGWLMSWYKTLILISFVAASIFIYRPWCRIFCPLGGLLALFNRFSLFHLQFNPNHCTECNTCRSRCPVGVKVDIAVNTTGCIRCLDCTACSSLTPAFAGLKSSKTNEANNVGLK